MSWSSPRLPYCWARAWNNWEYGQPWTDLVLPSPAPLRGTLTNNIAVYLKDIMGYTHCEMIPTSRLMNTSVTWLSDFVYACANALDLSIRCGLLSVVTTLYMWPSERKPASLYRTGLLTWLLQQGTCKAASRGHWGSWPESLNPPHLRTHGSTVDAGSKDCTTFGMEKTPHTEALPLTYKLHLLTANKTLSKRPPTLNIFEWRF